MNTWDIITDEIYEYMKYEAKKIYQFDSWMNLDILKNPILHLPDIFWELYYNDLINDGEYEIECWDEEWKNYESLLSYKEEGMETRWTFPDEIRRHKSSRKGTTLLGIIDVNSCKLDEDVITFPNYALIPFYVLYWQNTEFFTLFTKGKKNDLKYGENIIKCGDRIETFRKNVKRKEKAEETDIFPYVYEKLTGINLALLFANYYVDMMECLGLCRYNITYNKIEEDKLWKEMEKENKGLLKEKLFKLLEKAVGFPNIFGRIVWADIVLHSLYVEEAKCIERFSYDKGILFCKNNIYILNCFLEQIQNLIEEIEVEKKTPYGYPEGKNFVMNNNRFVEMVYDEYKEAVVEKLKEKKLNHVYEICGSSSENSRWRKIEEYVKKIIHKNDGETIVGSEDIGCHIQTDIKNSPDKEIPIIFIKHDIWAKEEYKKDINDFLVRTLELCKT